MSDILLLAERWRNQGNANEAVALLRRAVEAEPRRAALWNHLGLALRHACKPAEAMQAFRRAAQLEPQGRWTMTNLAFGNLRDPLDAAAAFAPLGQHGDVAEIGLGIFCDRFPHTYGFLLSQYTSLLRHFPDAQAYSFGRRVLEPFDPAQFADALAQYRELAPDLAGRVQALRPEVASPTLTRLHAAGGFRRPRLAYTQFAMNADLFRPLWEELGIPFAFTLNPGGGFRLDNGYSDDRLARVFASPWFRHVIVTYSRTRDYICRRFDLSEDKVSLIHGTIVVQTLLAAHSRPKRRYPADKDSLDICFAGLRYSPTGADKGYDRFIAAARLLAARFPKLTAHVVGNFDADTVELGDLSGRIRFHGQRDQRWMAGFFAGMDAIVSPNIADALAKGAFDGFPVTTCIEAGMSGVAVFATDPLGLNEALTADAEVVIIDAEPSRIADSLGAYLAQPERLYALAAAGQKRFHAHWGEETQMPPRIALLSRLLRAEEGA